MSSSVNNLTGDFARQVALGDPRILRTSSDSAARVGNVGFRPVMAGYSPQTDSAVLARAGLPRMPAPSSRRTSASSPLTSMMAANPNFVDPRAASRAESRTNSPAPATAPVTASAPLPHMPGAPSSQGRSGKNQPGPVDAGSPLSQERSGNRPVQVDANNAGTKIATDGGPVMPEVVCKGVEDFEFHEELGTGSYSTVVAAQDKQTLRQYAIKILDKVHIIKENKVKYVEIEKMSLNRLGEHPGIIHLYFTFQDRASLFFVLDYAPNGELLQLIKRLGSLDEACARYYTSQLVDAVEFMHSRGIVHRDLKPENILLDYKMRIKITDFGTAKIVDSLDDGQWPTDVRATSFVGTAEYVSPELLTQKFQGWPADIWAIGCVLFQMIAGIPPFQGNTQYLTFQKIVKYQYQIPPGFPFLVRDLLRNVFVSARRRYSVAEMKEHAFFDGVDWSRKGLWGQGPPKLARYRPTPASLSAPSPAFASASSDMNGGTPSAGSAAISSGAARESRRDPPMVTYPAVQPPAGLHGSSAAAAAAALLRSSSNSQQHQQQLPHHHHNQSIPHQSQQHQQRRHVNSAPSSQHSAQYRSSQERVRAMQRSIREQRAIAAAQPPVYATPPCSEAAAIKYRSTQSQPQMKQQAMTASRLQGQRSVSSSSKAGNTQPVSQQRARSGDAAISTQGDPTTPTRALSASLAASHLSPLDLTLSPSTNNDLSLPPIGPLEKEHVPLLISHNERIIKAGRAFVNVGSVGEGELDEESRRGVFARLFQTRRKSRIVVVTTLGRLVIADDDQKIILDLPLCVPQILVRQVLRRSGVMSLAVETYNRVISIDNDLDMSDWWAAILLAKRHVQHVNTESERNAHNAAAAAAIAIQRTR